MSQLHTRRIEQKYPTVCKHHILPEHIAETAASLLEMILFIPVGVQSGQRSIFYHTH